MNKVDDETIKRCMELINQTYGYGKKGTHKKKCEICSYVFDEPNDLDILFAQGPYQCPYCRNIEKLRTFINRYESYISDLVDKKHNLFQDGHFNFCYKIESQIKEGKIHSEELPILWRQLTVDIDGNFEILESIISGKYSFWEDGDTLKYYIHNSTTYFIIMRLVELVNKCRKLLNVIENNKKSLLGQKIHFVASDDEQKVICDEIIPNIDLDNSILIVKDIFEDLNPICEDLKKLRDKVVAHIDITINNDPLKSLSFINMKRVQNALKEVCSLYFLILAPHLYNPVFEIHGIDLDKMEYISKHWHNSTK